MADPLTITLVATGGSMLGSAVVQLYSQRLRNKRENAIKYAEARRRLHELRIEYDPDTMVIIAGYNAEARASFINKVNLFNAELLGLSPYLTTQQEYDLSILARAMAMPPLHQSKLYMLAWQDAESRVFPSRLRPKLRVKLKNFLNRIVAKLDAMEKEADTSAPPHGEALKAATSLPPKAPR